MASQITFIHNHLTGNYLKYIFLCEVYKTLPNNRQLQSPVQLFSSISASCRDEGYILDSPVGDLVIDHRLYNYYIFIVIILRQFIF